MLEDIRILDFGQMMFVPVGTGLLSHLGMDIIKIELVDGGWNRPPGGGPDGVGFHQTNVNKRSLPINLQDERSKDIMLKLVKTADVVVQNFRVGAMAKLGLDYASLSKINPRLIYCSASSYGETGPWAHRLGGDPYAQAMAGIVALQGSPDGPPYLAGPPIIDNLGAALVAYSIMAALFIRERTGVGQEVDLSLLNAAVYLQHAEISDYLNGGKLQKKVGRGFRGSFPFGAYTASDGDVMTLFGQDNDEWAVVCSMLGIEKLVSDPRYDTQEKRRERKFELYPILDQGFSKKTRAEWAEAFREKGLRCDPCLDHAELISHPQFQANGMLMEVDHPRDGRFKLLGSPVKFQGLEPRPARPAPILGEHTKEILSELGYTENEIQALGKEGVVRIATPEEMKPRPRTSGESMRHHTRGAQFQQAVEKTKSLKGRGVSAK